MNTPQLPVGYHVENLSVLLHSVMEQYQDLLTADEQRLLLCFEQLSPAGKSLYCRLLTRRGPILRQDRLRYEDITDLPATISELVDHDMASTDLPLEVETVLQLLTRPELNTHFPIAGASKLNKAQLISQILQQWQPDQLHQRLQANYPCIQAHFQEAFATYLLCFFGNSHQDLTEFVVNDLGHVRYEDYSLCRETRYFQSRQQIEQQIQYARARELLSDANLLQDADALQALAQSLPAPDEHPHLQRRYHKLLLEIARQLERLACPQAALALYQRCLSRHPARERSIRILHQACQQQAAYELCLEIQAQGQHPEELEFASRFLPRLEKALGIKSASSAGRGSKQAGSKRAGSGRNKATDWPALQLTLTATGDPVEWLAAEALSDADHQCYYVENTLINGLFGLLFWDCIFAAIPGAFINPFQRGPLDLSSEDFYPRRRDAIDARLQTLHGDQWQQVIWHHFNTKQGLANPFVWWEALSEELLQQALRSIAPAHLQQLFQRLLQHPGLYRSGFPDLIRFNPHGYELIEVKAPGDKLQANQIRWLHEFKRGGIPARVCWVKWSD